MFNGRHACLVNARGNGSMTTRVRRDETRPVSYSDSSIIRSGNHWHVARPNKSLSSGEVSSCKRHDSLEADSQACSVHTIHVLTLSIQRVAHHCCIAIPLTDNCTATCDSAKCKTHATLYHPSVRPHTSDTISLKPISPSSRLIRHSQDIQQC